MTGIKSYDSNGILFGFIKTCNEIEQFLKFLTYRYALGTIISFRKVSTIMLRKQMKSIDPLVHSILTTIYKEEFIVL